LVEVLSFDGVSKASVLSALRALTVVEPNSIISAPSEQNIKRLTKAGFLDKLVELLSINVASPSIDPTSMTRDEIVKLKNILNLIQHMTTRNTFNQDRFRKRGGLALLMRLCRPDQVESVLQAATAVVCSIVENNSETFF